MALAGLGFIAGAAVVALVGWLPPLSQPHRAAEQAVDQPLPRASYSDAVAVAAPAVVNVYGRIDANAPLPKASAAAGHPAVRESRGGTSLGSGVIVSGGGLIVTNAHIVEAADAIRVELADGRVLDARLAGIDDETDLAVLRTSPPGGGLMPIPLGDPGALAIGDVVLAIGNPYGIGQTVSLGIVSATGRSHLGLTDIENFIQTDAAINPGNSGGALVDAEGRLVGINTAILSASGHSEGVGFAIPVDMAMGVVDQLASRGVVRRGWIGIAGRSMTPQLAERFGLRAPHGVLVSSVVEDSPAAAAGILPGDVISRADGEALDSSLVLRERITATDPGRRMQLELWRGSQRLELDVATVERPPGGVAASTRRDSQTPPARTRPGGYLCRRGPVFGC
jgi:serine protease DegS